MTDKKLTDKDIKKALEGAILNAKKCDSKVWSIAVYKLENAFDLITRQQEKIERLKGISDNKTKELLRYNASIEELHKKLEIAKAEAYKDFAERLKEEYAQGINWFGVKEHYFVNVEDIENLLKEMAGENND